MASLPEIRNFDPPQPEATYRFWNARGASQPTADSALPSPSSRQCIAIAWDVEEGEDGKGKKTKTVKVWPIYFTHYTSSALETQPDTSGHTLAAGELKGSQFVVVYIPSSVPGQNVRTDLTENKLKADNIAGNLSPRLAAKARKEIVELIARLEKQIKDHPPRPLLGRAAPKLATTAEAVQPAAVAESAPLPVVAPPPAVPVPPPPPAPAPPRTGGRVDRSDIGERIGRAPERDTDDQPRGERSSSAGTSRSRVTRIQDDQPDLGGGADQPVRRQRVAHAGSGDQPGLGEEAEAAMLEVTYRTPRNLQAYDREFSEAERAAYQTELDRLGKLPEFQGRPTRAVSVTADRIIRNRRFAVTRRRSEPT
jgi:hypothetical protein